MKKSSAVPTTRVTISLPSALVRELDARLVHGETSRAAAIRQLIEAALHDLEQREAREARERALTEQYVRGWREHPDTEEEVGWMTSPQVLEHLSEIPWEPARDAATSGGRTSLTRGDDDQSF